MMKRASKTYTLEFISNDQMVYTIDILSDKEPKEVLEIFLKSKIYKTKNMLKNKEIKRLYLKDIEFTTPFYYWQVIDNSNGRIYYYV